MPEPGGLEPVEPLLSGSEGENEEEVPTTETPWEDVFAHAPFRKPRDLVTFSPPNLIVLSGSDEPNSILEHFNQVWA